MKAYILTFGSLSLMFPKSRRYDKLEDAQDAVDTALSSNRWRGVVTTVLILEPEENGQAEIRSIRKNGHWFAIP